MVEPTPNPTGQERLASRCIEGLQFSFARQRSLAERAIEQVSDSGFVAEPEQGNSLAVLVKHIGGNLRSRFTDFLCSDGEKPDRGRDQEFELGAADDRDHLMAGWRSGWACLEDTLESLEGQQLLAEVTIRGEPYSVVEAFIRAHDHIAYHVGQIAQLARLSCGASWQTLSIPRGASADYIEAVRQGKVSQRELPGRSASQQPRS